MSNTQISRNFRYFDLRVALNYNDGRFYFVHGLYCEEISEPFKELNVFLHSHPQEFVILDFQHFYDFNPESHQTLIGFVQSRFGGNLYRRTFSDSCLKQLTLSLAYRTGKQLLIIYRNNICIPDEFFRSFDFPTPWPNTTKIEDLKKILEDRLVNRSQNQGWVTQCILTPDANFIIPRFYSTLRKNCAKKVDKEMLDWIKDQTPGEFGVGDKPKSNIFLADFVDIRDNNFARNVISLNSKILETFEVDSMRGFKG